VESDKTVKDLIMESLESALKAFVSNPPNEAYSSGVGYFSWYVHIKDSEGNELTQNTEDPFYEERFGCSCVNCNIGLLEDVVMNDSTDFSEVEEDVRESFKYYLDRSDEAILKESADKVDASNSYFSVVVYEVTNTNSEEEEWVYYQDDHNFISD
tara:strand:- start:93 stop:557 length:465 start_codon:yes stop_codon:yes gene_type:complete